MIKANAREARQNFSHLLDQVESGEEVIILRRGHIIAHLIPHTQQNKSKRLPSLSNFRNSIKFTGKSLSETIIKDRKDK